MPVLWCIISFCLQVARTRIRREVIKTRPKEQRVRTTFNIFQGKWGQILGLVIYLYWHFLNFVEEKTMDELPVPENPEVVVFATYWSTPKYPVKVSVLGEMADASEKLRQNGLSHIYPHPVCISQTRSCPLEPPPPPEKIPAWKLIRPKKKKPAPSDEPVCK